MLSYVRRRIHSISQMDAEDIVSEVMLRIFSRSRTSGPVENLTAYVYRSVHNRIVDYQREQSRVVSLENTENDEDGLSLLDFLTDETVNLSRDAERKETLCKLAEAIGRLEPRQRAVFIATEMRGRSFRELSEEWQEPVGTLLARKSRAAKALREMLKEHVE